MPHRDTVGGKIGPRMYQESDEISFLGNPFQLSHASVGGKAPPHRVTREASTSEIDFDIPLRQFGKSP